MRGQRLATGLAFVWGAFAKGCSGEIGLEVYRLGRVHQHFDFVEQAALTGGFSQLLTAGSVSICPHHAQSFFEDAHVLLVSADLRASVLKLPFELADLRLQIGDTLR